LPNDKKYFAKNNLASRRALKTMGPVGGNTTQDSWFCLDEADQLQEKVLVHGSAKYGRCFFHFHNLFTGKLGAQN
jgi:hypothetical protein